MACGRISLHPLRCVAAEALHDLIALGLDAGRQGVNYAPWGNKPYAGMAAFEKDCERTIAVQ